MKIVKKDQRKEFKNSDCCLAYEYPMDDRNINGAVIKLSGRYPDKGWAANEVARKWAISFRVRENWPWKTKNMKLAPAIWS